MFYTEEITFIGAVIGNYIKRCKLQALFAMYVMANQVSCLDSKIKLYS